MKSLKKSWFLKMLKEMTKRLLLRCMTFLVKEETKSASKQAMKDYHSEENNSLSFSKGDLIQIYKENQGWGVEKAGDKK